MRGIKTMSLDAWLFGEDAQQQQSQQQQGQSQSDAGAAARPPRPLSASKTRSAARHAPNSSLAMGSASIASINITAPTDTTSAGVPSQSVARSNSLPVNSLSNRMAARAKKASLALVLPPHNANTNSTTTTTAAPHTHEPPTPHSELFPVSSKLRKLFRPNRLQWNRGRQSLTPEEKQRQLLGLSSESFQRLQGHVPFTLKEIVKDPKKLPYLLRWLSSDDEDAPPSVARTTNYHQVLLFLLEIEQLQLVADEKRKEQALKIWNKYIDHESEFQIATTLELTHELEALVRESIDSSDKVLDSFFPIQKLAYMRLTREEMPRFLKSREYLQMLIDTENDTESVPMERILQQPRAAHYFLLFLMQSRQHFELYFWLHVEYVLKPLLETESYDPFWKLARVLLKKAQHDSQAITLTTKNDLLAAISERRMDDKLSPPQPVAKALFIRAQQEIFVMLRSSWFNRFMKSNLYKIALKDCQIHLDKNESKEDSPPKLLSRTFSSLEYASFRQNGQSDDDESTISASAEDKHDEIREDESDEFVGAPLGLLPMEVPNELPSGSDDSSGVDSDASSEAGADDALDFSKMVLNLESIIRLTKLPDGLQVHYRPHYDAPTAPLASVDAKAPEDTHTEQLARQDLALDTVLTFSTALEKKGKGDPRATVVLSPVENPRLQKAPKESFEALSKRVKAFLVPDGRLVMKKSAGGGKPPSDMIFPFQQSGRDGFLYGYVYLTYEAVPVGRHQKIYFAAKGLCILSRFPLVRTLRRILETHLSERLPSERLDPAVLAKLFVNDVPVPSTQFVSQIPIELMRRRTRSESGAAQRALRKALMDTRVDVSVRPLFEYFGSAIALQILACALLECSIVFVSSQYSLLTACAEAVRCLLRPFSWCHVYAPVLPKPLLSYLQCPTPIVVGLHSSYAERGDLPTSGFCAVADMDRQVLEFVDARYSVAWRRLGLQETTSADGGSTATTTNTIFLPAAFEKAKLRLDKILRPIPRAEDVDFVSLHSGLTLAQAQPAGVDDMDLYGSVLKNDEERIRAACFELLSGLLEGHTEACLVVGDTKESVVIFDETQFLASRTAAEDGLFYQALFRSQCFSEIVSAHRIDTSGVEDDSADGEAAGYANGNGAVR